MPLATCSLPTFAEVVAKVFPVTNLHDLLVTLPGARGTALQRDDRFLAARLQNQFRGHFTAALPLTAHWQRGLGSPTSLR